MAIISYEEVPQLRETHAGKLLVFVSGSFDLTHAGHVRFLKGAKELGDVLMVAVGPDDQICGIKGGSRPVVPEGARLFLVSELRPVDYAFLNPPRVSEELLAPIREMLLAAQPDIWAINHDASQMSFRKKLAAELGIILCVLNLRREDPEWAEMSTTSIIEKVRGSV